MKARRPHIFLHRGVWNCLNWPIRGQGSTVRAACVDYTLKNLFRIGKLPV
jgi:hypothetical protein